MEKHVLVKKNFYKRVNHGLKEESMEWKHTDSLVKKRF